MTPSINLDSRMCMTLDFGHVGYKEQHQFSVRLDPAPLFLLIDHAAQCFRLAELLMIERPGDLWDYIWAVPIQVSAYLHRRLDECMQSNMEYSRMFWPDQHVPFTAFDKMLEAMWDDGERAADDWNDLRHGPIMNGYVQRLFEAVQAAKQMPSNDDPLYAHIVATVAANTHPKCFIPRRDMTQYAFDYRAIEPEDSPKFNSKVVELLNDPELESVAYRASGDYALLRMMATEQRKRANAKNLKPEFALFICALVDNRVGNAQWDSNILFFSEGIAYGELFIQGPGLRIPSLYTNYHGVPYRAILSYTDEGDLKGFSKEVGDGWVYYQNMTPGSRDAGRALVEERRQR